jgi:chemotaxis protein CheD
MIRNDNNMFGMPMYILSPGDYFATKDECVLGTVIGSCVVVCLYDEIKKIGGMGHFIVPGAIGTEGIIASDIAQHGVVSLEYLLGELIKIGGDRKCMKAKIFGAGYLSKNVYITGNVINSNIMFIHEYFSMEKIVVERNDLGGDFRRKIYFYPMTGKIFRKILQNNEESSEFVEMEKEYIDFAFRNREKHGRVILFE